MDPKMSSEEAALVAQKVVPLLCAPAPAEHFPSLSPCLRQEGTG